MLTNQTHGLPVLNLTLAPPLIVTYACAHANAHSRAHAHATVHVTIFKQLLVTCCAG